MPEIEERWEHSHGIVSTDEEKTTLPHNSRGHFFFFVVRRLWKLFPVDFEEEHVMPVRLNINETFLLSNCPMNFIGKPVAGRTQRQNRLTLTDVVRLLHVEFKHTDSTVHCCCERWNRISLRRFRLDLNVYRERRAFCWDVLGPRCSSTTFQIFTNNNNISLHQQSVKRFSPKKTNICHLWRRQTWRKNLLIEIVFTSIEHRKYRWFQKCVDRHERKMTEMWSMEKGFIERKTWRQKFCDIRSVCRDECHVNVSSLFDLWHKSNIRFFVWRVNGPRIFFQPVYDVDTCWNCFDDKEHELYNVRLIDKGKLNDLGEHGNHGKGVDDVDNAP